MTSLDDQIREIADDNHSGAVYLTHKAARILIRFADGLSYPSPEAFFLSLVEVARAIARAQPKMTPLLRLASGALFAAENIPDLPERRLALRTYCLKFLTEMEHNSRMVAEGGSQLIADGMTVLSHSYSATVRDALLLASSSGRRFKVICTESRPSCEGVELARVLAHAGIPVRLVVDALAFAFLPETDLVLCGADSISHRGLTNKAGTLGLAVAAAYFQKPVYGLCGKEKFRPAELPAPEEKDHNPGEIVASAPPGVVVVNRYFDLTPLDCFTGIVTERGVLTPASLTKHLTDLKLHPSLI